MLKRGWVRWIVIFAGWTAVALFFASQTYITYKYSSGHAPWGIIVKLALGEWYVWALLAPGIVWLARRLPLERGRWLRNLPLHLACGITVALLKWYVEGLVRHYILKIPGTTALVFTLHVNFLMYWLIVGASHGYDYYRRYREGELRASQLSAQLAQAQLQALKMQLHPHFLFNTLNAISTLVHRDPEAADRMIARLSDLLRLTLEGVGVQEVPLHKELEFLEQYLEIEQTRFADRLTVHMEISPETLGARTPYLILQPLVENAIRHGIAPRSQPGCITIRAERSDGNLLLEVRDDGPGMLSGRGSPPAGVGLSSTRARLERLYGAAHRLELKNAAEGGLIVRLVFPFQLAPPEAPNRQTDAGS